MSERRSGKDRRQYNGSEAMRVALGGKLQADLKALRTRVSEVEELLTARLESLAAQLATARAGLSEEQIEEYIARLPWSPDSGEFEKVIVCGNIRAFAADRRRACGFEG